MTLEEIASELVAGCRENRTQANLEKLYAPDAVSVEAFDSEGGLIFQVFARRSEDKDWRPDWNALVSALPSLTVSEAV